MFAISGITGKLPDTNSIVVAAFRDWPL